MTFTRQSFPARLTSGSGWNKHELRGAEPNTRRAKKPGLRPLRVIGLIVIVLAAYQVKRPR